MISAWLSSSVWRPGDKANTGRNPGEILKHFVVILLFIAAACPFELHGQTAKPASLEELAVYNGPDRLQLLVNGAKKEGKVVWYTAMAGGSYKELARAFEAKYGIPVEAYRGASRDLIAKMLAETQAKKYLMDVVESSPPLLMLMRDEASYPFQRAAPGEICSRGQRRDREKYGLLGYRSGIVYGFRLQQE